MTTDVLVRKFVRYEEEIHVEFGAAVSPALRRTAVGAVLTNPLLTDGATGDLQTLVEISSRLGEEMTQRALPYLGGASNIRAYSKAVIVGTAGDLEHGAAMIHSRLGMAMRRTIRRGRVLIPGNAKVAGPGAQVDMAFGPLDEGWDLDAMDTMTVSVADAPRPHEILLLVGYATGPRPNARSAGPAQADVDALLNV
jgi:hypothetical protein